jgi:hypothetical protein
MRAGRSRRSRSARKVTQRQDEDVEGPGEGDAEGEQKAEQPAAGEEQDGVDSQGRKRRRVGNS